MQSNGGSISAETAMNESVRTILFGPAGGAVGAHAIARRAGFHKLIIFDMGGTSTDVALIDGELPLTLESAIAGYPVKVPMIDIHTVGVGGGSIACLDEGGSLTVGPRSNLLRQRFGDHCHRRQPLSGPPDPRALPRRRNDPVDREAAAGHGRGRGQGRAHPGGTGRGDPGRRQQQHGARHPRHLCTWKNIMKDAG